MQRGISEMFAEFASNRVMLCSFAAWISAEIIKYLIGGFRRREWSLRYMFSSGGMPSSHTAAVFSLSMAAGFQEGFDSALFAVSGVFALVVMYDAAGVRRETGKQGSALNSIIDWLLTWDQTAPLDDADMKERVGHSPKEVLAGALLGLLYSLLFFLT